VSPEELLAHGAALKDGGAAAPEVFAGLRRQGAGRLDALRVLRSLFGLSLAEAKQVAEAVDGPGPGALPPLPARADLVRVLREELGYCGCAAYAEAVELLRDVLRCARDWEDALPDGAACRRATDALLARLDFDRVPGLATWFLYVLDQRDLIWHGPRVTVCGITRKGRWLLEALERLYPPPPES
jgi:hypothetical protein